MNLQGRSFIFFLIIILFGCKGQPENQNPDSADSISYRSVSFHIEPDSQMIQRAAQLGFNDVCIQTEGNTRKRLQQIRELEKEKGYMAYAKSLGMTTSLWMREISNYDEALGPVSIKNDTFWSKTASKYDHYFIELVPEVDYVVFTVVESQFNIADNKAILNKMIALVNDKCKEYGKKLILRTFVHHPNELDTLEKQLSSLPEDVAIMSKYVESDWNLRGPHHRLIGKVGGRDQIIELDIVGEYFRVTYVPNCFTDNLASRFNYWKDQGIDGISVRVTREPRPGAWWEPLIFPHSIYAEPNEVNLWALGYLATGKKNAVDKAWEDFVKFYFGENHTNKIINILRPQGNILSAALNVGTSPFGCLRLKIPGEWTMNGKHCSCGDTIAVVYPDSIDFLYSNPFHHKLSPHVWHPELTQSYHMSRKGDPEIIALKEKEFSAVISLSDSLIREFKTLQNSLDEDVYQYYLFKLEENNWHLRVMRHWQLSWLKAANMLYFGLRDKTKQEEIEKHFDSLILLNEFSGDHLSMNWHGKQIDIYRGEYLNIPGYITMFTGYWKNVLQGSAIENFQ